MLILYGGLNLVASLVLTNGWATIRRPMLFVPLIIAVLPMWQRTLFGLAAAFDGVILIYLHWRFELFKLEGQSCGRETISLLISMSG